MDIDEKELKFLKKHDVLTKKMRDINNYINKNFKQDELMKLIKIYDGYKIGNLSMIDKDKINYETKNNIIEYYQICHILSYLIGQKLINTF